MKVVNLTGFTVFSFSVHRCKTAHRYCGSLVVTIFTVRFNTMNSAFCRQCTYLFCIIVTMNENFFPLQLCTVPE